MTLPGRPVDRTGAMENALETLAADRTIVQARFPPHLGRRRPPPIRSTGKIVFGTLDDDVRHRWEETDRPRYCAPTSRSTSPKSPIHIPGIGDPLHRNTQPAIDRVAATEESPALRVRVCPWEEKVTTMAGNANQRREHARGSGGRVTQPRVDTPHHAGGSPASTSLIRAGRLGGRPGKLSAGTPGGSVISWNRPRGLARILPFSSTST